MRIQNGSQFFITTAVTTWLDGMHVVFGEVSDKASQELVRTIEKLGSEEGDVSKPVKISDCGQL